MSPASGTHVGGAGRRWATPVIVSLLAAGIVGAPGGATGAAAAGAARFVATGPCRVLDTRQSAALAAGEEMEIDIAGACGVPASATAAALTFTVTRTTAAGYLSTYAAGVDRPEASTVNWDHAGQTVANSALLALSPTGALAVWASAGLDLVVDVTGAFVPAVVATSGRYVPLSPRRVTDTRRSGTVAAAPTIELELPTGVPSDAVALAVNVTMTATAGSGYVSAAPAGSPPNEASFLNADDAGQTRAAAVILPVSTGGVVLSVFGSAHVIVDVTGYFTGPSAAPSDRGLFNATTPTRIFDTRREGPQVYHHGAREFAVAAITGGPVGAVAANVTMTATTAPGWVAAYPARTTLGEWSTLNADAGDETVANLALTAVSTLGVGVYSDGGTQLVVDITGWFSGVPLATTTSSPPSNEPPPKPVLPGCFPTGRSAVADKAAQRYWLCENGEAITDALPMTTGGFGYGLPPVGTYPVFARLRYNRGIHGELLNYFVAFYRTPRGNRIAFHEVVNQPPDTVGDLDRRGSSAGCFRVRRDDAVAIWNFLQLGDRVVVITR